MLDEQTNQPAAKNKECTTTNNAVFQPGATDIQMEVTGKVLKDEEIPANSLIF